MMHIKMAVMFLYTKDTDIWGKYNKLNSPVRWVFIIILIILLLANIIFKFQTSQYLGAYRDGALVPKISSNQAQIQPLSKETVLAYDGEYSHMKKIIPNRLVRAPLAVDFPTTSQKLWSTPTRQLTRLILLGMNTSCLIPNTCNKANNLATVRLILQEK